MNPFFHGSVLVDIQVLQENPFLYTVLSGGGYLYHPEQNIYNVCIPVKSQDW